MSVDEFLKTLLPPLLISLVLFLLVTYLLIPLYRHHRNRYRAYAPLSSLESPLSFASLRDVAAPFRAVAALLPAAWRWEYLSRFRRNRDADEGGAENAEGEGDAEAMLDMPPGYDHVEREWQQGDTERRLSRELEEGFRDDSDDE